MNMIGVSVLYRQEMKRFFRTILQSFFSPVLSTSLYFVVFGGAIGSRIESIDGVDYASFIVPGLIMLSVMTQSTSNASFGIFFPRFFGSFYEILSAPMSFIELTIGYVGAAATKALFIGLVILGTASVFVDFQIAHPLAMFALLIMTCINFALLGFILGIWSESFEQVQLVPLLVITPLVFLGGSFYSIAMLPPLWQNITFFNPLMYLISAFRWSFLGIGDVSIGLSLVVIFMFTTVCLTIIWWFFHSGWKIRS